MSLRHIGAWLLRRWPLVGGVLLLAVIAAALTFDFLGSRGITAQAPTPKPTPNVIFETPTKEQWKAAMLTVTPIVIIPTPDPRPRALPQVTPRSKAHAEFIAAPEGTAFYMYDLDRVVYLPEGVYFIGSFFDGHCSGSASRCRVKPVYTLETRESYADIDAEGYYYVHYGNPEEFQFLTDAGFTRWE